MKARSFLLGTVAAVSLGGAVQAAPFHGWYVSVEGGANWVQDSDFTNFIGLTNFADRYSYNTGWAALASLGYSFNSHWRLEGEFGYRSNDVDQFLFGGEAPSNVDGTLRQFTVMANAIYDIPLTEKLDFSIGAGIGADNARLKSNIPAFGFSDDQWNFAYQGIAGLNYQVGRRSQLFVDYRYLAVDSPTFTHGLNEYDFNNLHSQTLTVGLRYDLSPDEEAAAPPPPPPPPPMQPTAPKSFVIFFGFNKCNITSEADRVLGEAAASAQSYGSASVEIVGHTDTVGSPRYNQRLSECRANAAAANLEGKGIASGSIHVSGRGEDDLLIQTGDGVKEPQNRRDTITLD